MYVSSHGGRLISYLCCLPWPQDLLAKLEVLAIPEAGQNDPYRVDSTLLDEPSVEVEDPSLVDPGRRDRHHRGVVLGDQTGQTVDLLQL